MIDKNYAPPGCEAKRAEHAYSCAGCIYNRTSDCPPVIPCTHNNRPDRISVIFVKKPPQWEHVGTGAVSILRNAQGRVIEAKIVFE